MALVQSVVASSDGASPSASAATLTSVAAGNTLVVTIAQTTSATRTYTVSSNLDGSLTAAVSHNVGRGAHVFYLHNASAGNHTLTATVSSTVINFEISAQEWSGLDTGASPITGTFDTGSNATGHFSAAVGSIDTTTGAAIIVSAVLNATGSTTTAGTNYTKITPNGATAQAFFQHYDAASAVTDDRGEWSSSTARQVVGCMAAFPVAASSTLAASVSATGSVTGALTTSITAAGALSALATVTADLQALKVARPSSTSVAGSWTAVGAATLHAATNDSSDTTYIQSSAGATTDTCLLGFPAMGTPEAGPITVFLRYRS